MFLRRKNVARLYERRMAGRRTRTTQPSSASFPALTVSLAKQAAAATQRTAPGVAGSAAQPHLFPHDHLNGRRRRKKLEVGSAILGVFSQKPPSLAATPSSHFRPRLLAQGRARSGRCCQEKPPDLAGPCALLGGRGEGRSSKASALGNLRVSLPPCGTPGLLLWTSVHGIIGAQVAQLLKSDASRQAWAMVVRAALVCDGGRELAVLRSGKGLCACLALDSFRRHLKW